jgi:hypothetical protein
MREISDREIRPCLRKARITSNSVEFNKMGAVTGDLFFVPGVLPADMLCTFFLQPKNDDEAIGNDKHFHYSHRSL